jgi:hypothetical protein
MYREIMDSWCPEKQEHECPQLARQVYDMLVSIRSGLFGTSSPLRLSWLVDDIFVLFGRDFAVMESMETLKTEFALFGRTLMVPSSRSMKKHLLMQGTDKFQGHRHKKDALIFEHEMKGMKRPSDLRILKGVRETESKYSVCNGIASSNDSET